MIMNEQTTIDDAINDALLMINKSKESIKWKKYMISLMIMFLEKN